MKNVIQCLSVVALAFTLFACKKDAATPTKTELLTAHAWKITASEATLNGVKQDIFAQMSTCERDNFETFKTDKTFVSDEGATKCDPSDPQTAQGKWTFLTNDTKLELTVTDGGSSYTITYDIGELTADKLVLKFTAGTNSGTATYGKK
jgi:Lipocalin-like domain